MKDSLLSGTTGMLDEETVEHLQSVPHLTVLMTPQLAQVGRTRPLGEGELPLHRGVLEFSGELLADRLISRDQAVIRARGRSLEIVDRGSRHGTWLNGQRLSPDKPTALAVGDRIYIGRSLLMVQQLPPDPEGWERDLAMRRVAGQCKDRESRLSEQRAVSEIHAQLLRSTLVGTSDALRTARRDALAAARLDGPVLVTGPTGTGKEAVAAAIHTASRRRRAPYVAFSCAEVAPNLVVAELFGAVKGAYTGAERDRVGLWRTASRGTLFLDEIGDAPPELQAALLRAIESGSVRPVGGTEPITVDVRLVAATKRELDREVAAERFRDDLLFRLAGTRVRLPPLADRGEDAVILFATALTRFGLSEAKLGREAIEALWSHRWPGNGREVVHLAERVAADVGDSAEIRLPSDFGSAASASAAAPHRSDEKRTTPDGPALEEALRRHGGNLTAVAREYGVRRQQVYRWVERFGIALDEVRGDG